MSEDKPILKWALQYPNGYVFSSDVFDTREEARGHRLLRTAGLHKPSVVRVQITVLKDRK